jgi:hypothetical protein
VPAFAPNAAQPAPIAAELKKAVYLMPPQPGDIAAFYAPVSQDAKFKLQRLMTHAWEDATFEPWLASLNKADRIRIGSLRGPGASAYKSALPTSRHLTLNSRDYIVSRRFDYGLQPAEGLTECVCGTPLVGPDADPTHFMSCAKAKRMGLTVRHDGLVNLTCLQANRAGCTANVEPRPDDFGPRKRPDGRQEFFDHTHLTDNQVNHPCTPTHLRLKKAAEVPGHCMLGPAKAKQRKYKPVTDALGKGAVFTPLHIESYGRLHPAYMKFLRLLTVEAEMTGRIEGTHKSRSQYMAMLVQEVSVCLHRGNARLLAVHASKARSNLGCRQVRRAANRVRQHNDNAAAAAKIAIAIASAAGAARGVAAAVAAAADALGAG